LSKETWRIGGKGLAISIEETEGHNNENDKNVSPNRAAECVRPGAITLLRTSLDVECADGPEHLVKNEIFNRPARRSKKTSLFRVALRINHKREADTPTKKDNFKLPESGRHRQGCHSKMRGTIPLMMERAPETNRRRLRREMQLVSADVKKGVTRVGVPTYRVANKKACKGEMEGDTRRGTKGKLGKRGH